MMCTSRELKEGDKEGPEVMKREVGNRFFILMVLMVKRRSSYLLYMKLNGEG